METLGDAYPKMQARVRDILQVYRELGPVGVFGATMIEDCLRRADRAAIEGDLPAMIALYKEMEDIE